MRFLAIAAASLALAAPASALEAITFAQFFQTTGTKIVSYRSSGGTATISVTRAPVLFNAVAFGPTFTTQATFRLTSTTSAPRLATLGGGLEQNGFAGSFSFTSGSTNLLTATFADAKMTVFEGGGSGSFGATQPPAFISYTSDVLNVENLVINDFALAFSAINPTATLTRNSWNANVSGTFAGAIPEPATWALLIAGFGLVGMAARRRRTSAAIA